MTEIRFQADADLRQAIVTGTIRRQPNLDFQSANKAGLEGLTLSGLKTRRFLIQRVHLA
jgi:hypothetical protein